MNQFDSFNKQVTREDILRQVSDKEIFEHYAGQVITHGTRISSPFRTDNNPSCSFAKIGTDWILKDFSTGHSWKCFKFVMDMFNVSYFSALTRIHEDLNLQNSKSPIITEITKRSYVKRTKPKLVVTTQDFTDIDKHYLIQYGINRELCLKYNVYSVRSAWMSNRPISNAELPTLGYYFGVDANGNHKWKLYFYKRKERRFITNTNRIQGWVQIPDSGSRLIITKSLKDVMVLDKLGYPSIAPQGESFVFYDYIIDQLKQRFTKIYVLYDNDKAGIENSNRMREMFDLNTIQLDEEKDISDLVKAKGILHAKQTINKSIIQS